METQTIFKFFIPIAILTSIFLGPAYNLLLFLNTHIIEFHWSIYVNDVAFANLMALTFILFSVLFIITMKFVEKLTQEPLIIIGIIVISFSSVYAGLIWVWEIIILTFIMTSATLAFLIPVVIKYTSDIIQEEYEDERYILVLPIGALLWIFVSLFFQQLGTKLATGRLDAPAHPEAHGRFNAGTLQNFGKLFYLFTAAVGKITPRMWIMFNQIDVTHQSSEQLEKLLGMIYRIVLALNHHILEAHSSTSTLLIISYRSEQILYRIFCINGHQFCPEGIVRGV